MHNYAVAVWMQVEQILNIDSDCDNSFLFKVVEHKIGLGRGHRKLLFEFLGVYLTSSPLLLQRFNWSESHFSQGSQIVCHSLLYLWS